MKNLQLLRITLNSRKIHEKVYKQHFIRNEAYQLLVFQGKTATSEWFEKIHITKCAFHPNMKLLL